MVGAGGGSEAPLIQHLVDPITDLLQVSAINLRGAVESRQKVAVGKVIEDVVDSRVALGCQVALDGLVQQFAAIIQNGAHDAAVKGELNLVETDRRHGQSVDFLPVRQTRRREAVKLAGVPGAPQAGKNRNCCLVDFTSFTPTASFIALSFPAPHLRDNHHSPRRVSAHMPPRRLLLRYLKTASRHFLPPAGTTLAAYLKFSTRSSSSALNWLFL